LRVDLVFDLEFFTRYSALLAYLSGAPNRVGFWSRLTWRGDLLTHPVYYNATKHISRIFVALAEAVGQPWDEAQDFLPLLPKLSPAPEASASVEARLRAEGLDPAKPLLLVNPNASPLCFERRWMPERFAQVVDKLQAGDPRLQAVFIGSGSEQPHTAHVASLCQGSGPRAVLAGGLSLRELLALLEKGKLLLTNDSGPLHLATLAGTPTLALFGPETPALYGPLGGRQKALYAGVYCSPCLNVFNSKTAPCKGDNICMQAFQVNQVLGACQELLQLSPA
jgi:ADP-heptose:LPS heptosyltransferase